MFATRDQENLVHARQTNAAGKPLNQGIKSLQPKTPGNVKTPFRAAKNDENQNVLFQGQKTLLKGGGSKLSNNAFVTPAATKTRAPLGAKTTNAKAQPLKTPGLGQTVKQDRPPKQQLSTGRRSARKITVAPTEPVQEVNADVDVDDEPDFGYAPPPITELPDPPIDFDYDQSFPQFRPENMFKGYGEIYFGSPKDDDGISLRLKEEEERYRLAGERERKELLESIARQESTRSDPDAEVDAMIASGPKPHSRPKESRVDTIKAKSAATALSAIPPTVPVTQSKSYNSSVPPRKAAARPVPKSSLAGTKPPFSVSRNTIGFPKARQPPSIIPKTLQRRADVTKMPQVQPINQKDIHPVDFVKLYGEPPVESDMWFRLKQHELVQKESEDLFDADEDLAGELSDLDFFSPTFQDDDDVFQLPVPEE